MHNTTERFVEFWSSTVSNLLANLLIVILTVVFTPIILAIIGWFGQTNRLVIIVLLALGWLASSGAFTIFYFQRREDYKGRIVSIAKRMFVSDTLVTYYMATPNTPKLPEDKVRVEIERLLDHLPTVIVGRVPITMKAVNLLILQPDGTFFQYAAIGHNEAQLDREVKVLRREESMAGQALKTGKCLVLRNSADASERDRRKITWQPGEDLQHFRGRAMAPVVALTSVRNREEIGVLCFDIKKPWALNTEDQELLLVYADKIATLWKLCH